MNLANLSNLKNLLASAVTPFIVVACCGGGFAEGEVPDDQLQIEVTEPAAPSTDQSTEAGSVAACGATVIARDDDGEEIVLEERTLEDSAGNSRCVYRGTVDPTELYTVEIQREGQVATLESMQSNPACSTVTDPNDDDGGASLTDPAIDTNDAAVENALSKRAQPGLTASR